MARHPAPSLRSGMLAASSGFLGPSSFPNRPRTSHDGVSQRFVQLSRVRRERRTVQSLVDTHDKSDVVRKNVELHDETVLDSIKWNEAGLVTVIVQVNCFSPTLLCLIQRVMVEYIILVNKGSIVPLQTFKH